MKKLAVSLIACAGLFVGGVASAQTYYPQTYPSYPNPVQGCVALTRDLSYGSRGSDVKALQTFLVAQHYPGGGSWMITGFFGRATESAVRIFQQTQGMYPSGVVDAQTRSAMNRGCGYNYGYNYNYPYSTYPVYGGVTISSLSSYTVSAGATLTINGSGFDYANNTVYVGGNAITNVSSFNGTTLTITVPTYVTGTQQIYVTNTRGSSNSLSLTISSYNTCSSTYPYNCGCTTSYPYSNCNGCTYSYNCAISISSLSPQSGVVGSTVTIYGTGFSLTGNTVHFGNGIISNLSSSNGNTITFTVPSYLTGYGSQYVTNGSYNVYVQNAQGSTSNTLSFLVTNSGSYGAPTITNVSGPTSIQTNTSGTWSVTVNNNQGGNGYISTSVNWGDTYYGYVNQSAPQTSYVQGVSTQTFTHSYTNPGTYTITFTVSNASGQSNSSSMTVTVGSGSTSGAYMTASPQSGSAPLTVTFNGVAGGCNPTGYYIFYGDGTSDYITIGSYGCNQSFTRTHTYQNSGTFTATLRDSAQNNTLQSLSITVGNGVSGSLSASPSSGTHPLQVLFTGTGNSATYSGGVVILFGDGSAASFCTVNETCNSRTISHTYTGSGTYYASLQGSNNGSNTTLGSATIYVN